MIWLVFFYFFANMTLGIWSRMSRENADREIMIENSILADSMPYGSLKLVNLQDIYLGFDRYERFVNQAQRHGFH